MQPDTNDLAWREMTVEGLKWSLKQRPKGRDIPFNKPGELEIINRRLRPLTGGTTPPISNIRVPRCVARAVKTGRWTTQAYSQWHLWQMPYMHTAYMTDLNAYWQWYTEIRPGCHSWTLEDRLKDKSRDLYQICRAIANERKAYRLRKAA